MSEKKQLQVEAIRNGSVIDHIPAGQGIKILKLFHLLDTRERITVGLNLPSAALVAKEVIGVELNRDAVQDANGQQFKLLCGEDKNAAQLEFVIGSNGGGLSHDLWRENLKLACAVQETLYKDYPSIIHGLQSVFFFVYLRSCVDTKHN
jgi:hypothetical protein